jgi:DegV family protein with EDD domain
MKEFVIFTDVNTDVNEEYAKAENIVILPQYYRFDGEEEVYGDEIKLSSPDFYERILTKRPFSMGCNPARVEELFREALDAGKDILCIMFSSKLSGSCGTVRAIGEELTEEYDANICVIDSLNASMGAGIMVYMANDLKKQGKSLDEITKTIEDMKDKFHALFIVDDLKYLVQGGRLNPISGAVGNVLDIKPLLYLNDGEIQVFKKSRTRKKAIAAIMEEVFEGNAEDKYISIVHTNNEASAIELAKKVKEKYGIEIDIINEINPTIGTHTGPNALGFGYVKK